MLEILTSDLLAPMRHGFFTRRGGASSGVFKGLNCGVGSTDQSEAVAINRSRVAEAMGVPATHLQGVHQIHSPDVVTIDAPIKPRPKADALVTRQPGIAISVLTADCQPILMCDPDAQVIGAAHAGWKGARDGVIENTVAAMEALGAARGNIRAVIGPCISQASYEVGADFRTAFLEIDPDFARFFTKGSGGRYQFDLPGFGLLHLRRAGVQHAAWIGHCTYDDPARFYSYRRTTHTKEADYGRLISTISLPQ